MKTLREFICPNCGKWLVWALAAAKVHCNQCDTVVTADNSKATTACLLSDQSEQLAMF